MAETLLLPAKAIKATIIHSRKGDQIECEPINIHRLPKGHAWSGDSHINCPKCKIHVSKRG